MGGSRTLATKISISKDKISRLKLHSIQQLTVNELMKWTITSPSKNSDDSFSV